MDKKYSIYASESGVYDKVGNFEIPSTWWSRRFEYPWAAKFINKDDVVVDAGCGISDKGHEHFFKYYLAENSEYIYGVDMHPDLLNLNHNYDNLKLICSTINKIPLEDNVADKLVCISVLEHTKKNIPDILTEFARILKPMASAIITIDIPTISLDEWINMVEDSFFAFIEDIPPIPEDVLVEARKGRSVFCCVLRNEKEV